MTVDEVEMEQPSEDNDLEDGRKERGSEEKNDDEKSEHTYLQSEMSADEYATRESIYERTVSTMRAVHFTYKRMYVAAEWVGRFGWGLDFFTAIIGTVLLYVLTRTEGPNFLLIGELSSLAPSDLAIILLISSLLSAFYGPKLRSRDYYNSGQELQELYDDLRDFVVLELRDPSLNSSDIESNFKELNKRRHNLNQSTPQLGGHWYRAMKWKGKYKSLVPWEDQPNWEPPEFDPEQLD